MDQVPRIPGASGTPCMASATGKSGEVNDELLTHNMPRLENQMVREQPPKWLDINPHPSDVHQKVPN